MRADQNAQIVIPSHLRAGAVTTAPEILPPDTVILCVPESQADDYRREHPDIEVVAHPDTVLGLSMKRQWIYERWGDVIMVDDDQTVFWHFEHDAGVCMLEPEVGYAVLQRLAGEAEQMGVFLYGVSPYPDIRNYNPLRPVRLSGYVCGGVVGMRRGSKLAYHSEIVCTEDYWISALNAYWHRMALIDLRYSTTSRGTTFTGTGGMASQRSMEAERRDNDILKRAFGTDVIRSKKFTGTSKGFSGHEAARTMILPF